MSRPYVSRDVKSRVKQSENTCFSPLFAMGFRSKRHVEKADAPWSVDFRGMEHREKLRFEASKTAFRKNLYNILKRFELLVLKIFVKYFRATWCFLGKFPQNSLNTGSAGNFCMQQQKQAQLFGFLLGSSYLCTRNIKKPPYPSPLREEEDRPTPSLP